MNVIVRLANETCAGLTYERRKDFFQSGFSKGREKNIFQGSKSGEILFYHLETERKAFLN